LSDLRYDLNKLKSELEPLLTAGLDEIVHASERMVFTLCNLIQVKKPTMKISMILYEWATGKDCPLDSNGEWSLANRVLRNIKLSEKT
jgi:hypothetical protein